MSTHSSHPALHASLLHAGPMFGRQVLDAPRKTSRLYRRFALASIGMVVAGLIGLSAAAWQGIDSQRSVIQPPASAGVAAPVEAPAQTDTIGGKPVRLQVAAANIDITVADGYFNQHTGEWTLSDDKAYFATPTVESNNKSGGTLIYGHNTPQVFVRLHDLPYDAEAKVYTQNGHVLTYALRSSEIVEPSDSSIFDYQGAPRLTLQTCTGIWSEDRKFFHFVLIAAQ